MNFIEHAKIIIPALTGLTVTIWNEEEHTLEEFERRFCFLSQIQSLYTTSGLLQFFKKKDDKHIYTITDPLDTHVIILKIEENWIILGPYVTSPWKDTAAAELLARRGLQESTRLPYKLYRCGLPLIEHAQVIRIAVLLLNHTVGNQPPHEIEAIIMDKDVSADARAAISYEHEELSVINRRYALEGRFMDAVTAGKTEEAIRSLSAMTNLLPGLRYKTNDIKDQIAGAAISRANVRRAAVQAGLTPVLIDSISQEYAQKMHLAADEAVLQELLEQYIADICYAVRTHRKDKYSVYVRRAVQYIETHLSQSISVDELCRLNDISRKHFVQLFGKETGKTVNQYIMQLRCERAAELLENSQLLVQEISSYVGYEDNNYFAKVFKNVMGVSPQEYRKRKTFY